MALMSMPAPTSLEKTLIRIGDSGESKKPKKGDATPEELSKAVQLAGTRPKEDASPQMRGKDAEPGRKIFSLSLRNTLPPLF